MNHSATEKSHPFLHTSGSNQVNVFVNKTKKKKMNKNVFSKCKNKLRLML